MALSCLIRVDYHHAIGSGHAQRCLALASELVCRGWQVDFLGFIASEHFLLQLSRAGIRHLKTELLPLARDLEKISELAPRYTVTLVDGYQFDATYFHTLHPTTRCLAVIDDQGLLDFYDTDFIINQNPTAANLKYRSPEKTKRLFGLDYALLRKEFIEARLSPPTEKKIDILVTMGGSDTDNVGGKILQALEASNLSDCRITLLAGALNTNTKSHQEFAIRSRHQVTIIPHSDRVSDLMRDAKMAITAAGSTCWELCCLGVPFVTVVLAENQKPNASYLHRYGVAPTVQVSPQVDESSLFEAVVRQKDLHPMAPTLVDGQGASRIAKSFELFLPS